MVTNCACDVMSQEEDPQDNQTNPATPDDLHITVGTQVQKGDRQDAEVEEEKRSICRICHGGSSSAMSVSPLTSPCDCKGTVEKVHIACLERWLTESGSDTCELCGFKFRVERIPRDNIVSSFITWLSTDIDARQLILDFLWFCLMTPLALIAGYLIIVSSRLLMNMRIEDNPWIMVSLLMTSCLTLVAYYGWAVTVLRHHTSCWLRWWRSNFIVHLLVEPPVASL